MILIRHIIYNILIYIANRIIILRKEVIKLIYMEVKNGNKQKPNGVDIRVNARQNAQ